MAESLYQTLNSVSPHVEKKGHLTFIPWADAWHEVNMLYPNAEYVWHENSGGTLGFWDSSGVYAKVTVIIEERSCTAWLPVMDHKFNAIPPDQVTAWNVNKAYQRAFTKAIAMHGLGISVFRGEDLPDNEKDVGRPRPQQRQKRAPSPQRQQQQQATPQYKKDLGNTLSSLQITSHDRPFSVISFLSNSEVEGWPDVTEDIAKKASVPLAFLAASLVGSDITPREVILFAKENGMPIDTPAGVNATIDQYNDMLSSIE